MRVTYNLSFDARCPVNGAADDSPVPIMVENILQAVVAATKQPTTQEDITAHIARALPGPSPPSDGIPACGSR